MALLYPQEVEVFYLIPAIRKEIAFDMKALGKEQKEISELLGITEAAVSQYFTNKRATDVKLSYEIRNEIKQSASRIKGKQDALREVQKILALMKETREICKIHHKFAKVPRGCDICFSKK